MINKCSILDPRCQYIKLDILENLLTKNIKYCYGTDHIEQALKLIEEWKKEIKEIE